MHKAILGNNRDNKNPLIKVYEWALANFITLIDEIFLEGIDNYSYHNPIFNQKTRPPST